MTRLPAPLRPMFPMVKRAVVAATSAVGPVTRRLPSSPRRPGPPRRLAADTAEYAARHPRAGITVSTVVPEIERRSTPPTGFPPRHAAFARGERALIPPAVVACLPGGRAVGGYGAVVTADDTLLFDLSPYYGVFRPHQHPIFLHLRLPPPEDVDGAVALLTTRGADNYFHFLTDVLPRLELLRRAGATPDRFIVNRVQPFQRELLDNLGISAPVTVQSADHPHVRAERLLVASLPDSHLRAPPWMVSWLRHRFLPGQVAGARRRLYVTRGTKRHTRRVDNEPEVFALLEPLGIEVVDPGRLSVAAQVQAFSEAELVIGPHGAGLANIAFCPPGAAVVELFAPDYVNPCYWNLASAVDGLRYRYVVSGQAKGRRAQSAPDSDVRVDLGSLRRVLGELGVPC